MTDTIIREYRFKVWLRNLLKNGHNPTMIYLRNQRNEKHLLLSEKQMLKILKDLEEYGEIKIENEIVYDKRPFDDPPRYSREETD